MAFISYYYSNLKLIFSLAFIIISNTFFYTTFCLQISSLTKRRHCDKIFCCFYQHTYNNNNTYIYRDFIYSHVSCCEFTCYDDLYIFKNPTNAMHTKRWAANDSGNKNHTNKLNEINFWKNEEQRITHSCQNAYCKIKATTFRSYAFGTTAVFLNLAAECCRNLFLNMKIY